MCDLERLNSTEEMIINKVDEKWDAYIIPTLKGLLASRVTQEDKTGKVKRIPLVKFAMWHKQVVNSDDLQRNPYIRINK